MSEPFDLLTLPFDQYQRYSAISQISDAVRSALPQSTLRILDVGGFFCTRLGQSILPLARFLPEDSIVAVDLVIEALDNYAVASGFALPFGDASFDLVVSCDTLEHVAPERRADFVHEVLRVAQWSAVIAAPFDSEANQNAERMLDSYMRSQGMLNPQLQEHLSNGLPSLDALRDLLTEHHLAFFEFGDGYLPNWLAMMLVKHTRGLALDLQIDLDRWYNSHLASYDRREPAYRHVLVIATPGNEGLLYLVANTVPASPPVSFPDSGFEADLGRVLEHAKHREPSALASLEAESKRLRQLVVSYEQGRFMRLMRWLHTWRRRLSGRADVEQPRQDR